MSIIKLFKLLHISVKSSTFAQKLKLNMKNLKEYWNNSSKVGRIFFWSLLIIGVAMIIGSYFLPPLGEIHPSTLEAFGIVQFFVSVGWGFELLDSGKKKKLEVTHGDMSVTVSNAKE